MSANDFKALMEHVNTEVVKACLIESVDLKAGRPGSYVAAVAHAHVHAERLRVEWQRHLANFGVPIVVPIHCGRQVKLKRPKWGQRNRKRLRKTRQSARRANEVRR